jgi:hypothetical protein
MRTLITTLTLLFTSFSLLAQVGIGTASPSTDLEIVAKTGLSSGEFNGVIIPKVPILPIGSDLPSAAQTGLILYLDSNNAEEGFYYFNGSSYVNVNATSAFYNSSTTQNASNTTNEIYRTGRTKLGSDAISAAVLSVGNLGALASEDRTILSVSNRHTSTAAAASTPDTRTLNLSNTSVTGRNKIGIYNEVSVSGLGSHIGIENRVDVNNSSNFTNYGIRSVIGATTTSNQELNGLSIAAGNTSANGVVYGIKSVAINDGSVNAYSGYFQGDKFTIRSADDATGYDMPVNNGAAGQVLTTNGAGVASWGNATSTKSIVRAHIGTQWLSSSGSSNPGDYLIMEFDQESIDTNNEFDTSTYTFTAANTGYFKVSVQVSSNDYDGDTTHGLAIYKGANLVSQDVRRHSSIGSTSEDNINRSLTDIVQLNSGETITIRFNDNFATFAASTERNFFTIEQL